MQGKSMRAGASDGVGCGAIGRSLRELPAAFHSPLKCLWTGARRARPQTGAWPQRGQAPLVLVCAPRPSTNGGLAPKGPGPAVARLRAAPVAPLLLVRERRLGVRPPVRL